MTRFRTYCSRADQLSLAAMAQAPTPGVPGSAEQAAVPSAVPRDAEKLAEKNFNREVKPDIAEPTPGESGAAGAAPVASGAAAESGSAAAPAPAAAPESRLAAAPASSAGKSARVSTSSVRQRL